MAKNLELSIGPNYIPDWGAWEAIREFIQNALDADQAGYKMDIRRNPNGTLVIRNDGASLKYSDLVLGSSSKGDGTFRGQYGEGFKLAMMVLCRMARDNGNSEPPIRIKTGSEMWRPTIVQSRQFNTDVLNVEITNVQDDNGITVYIPHISEQLWKMIKDRVLELSEKARISSRYGDILTDSSAVGQLYVKGLWISEMNQKCSYGYNIVCAVVDRDRKMADQNSLRSGFVLLMTDLVASGKMYASAVLDLLLKDEGGNGFESDALTYVQGSLRDALCVAWEEKFGTGAIACVNPAQVNKVRSLGGTPVNVSHSLQLIVNPVASYERFYKTVSLGSKKVYNFDETMDEIGATSVIPRIIAMVRNRLPKPFNNFTMEFVDFVNPDIRGTCNAGSSQIQIAKGLVSNPASFTSTFIHELAHLDGSLDFTKSHIENIQEIGGLLVSQLMESDSQLC